MEFEGTVEELFKKYYKIFKGMVGKMKPSQAMDAWLVNARRVDDQLYNLSVTTSYSTEDYNRMVFWSTYLDALKAAVEDTQGGIKKLQESYPDKALEISNIYEKINNKIPKLEERSTEHGDLRLQKKQETRTDWLKAKFGLSNDQIALLANGNPDAVTQEQAANILKWLSRNPTQDYKFSQAFPNMMISGMDAARWFRETYGTVTPTGGDKKLLTYAGITAAGVGAYFMLKG